MRGGPERPKRGGGAATPVPAARLAGAALRRGTVLLLRRVVARKTAEAVGAERTRLRRELHDTLAQGLTGIRLHVDSALNNIGDAARATENLLTVRQLIRATFVDMKRVLLDLGPRELSAGDFIAALHEMVRTMTECLAVDAVVRAEGTPRLLPSETEHQLFRIAQEAVTNALRHARARRLEILVIYAPEALEMAVSDDGLGSGSFSPAELRAGARNGGTAGMQARAEQIGATFTIERNGSQGLSVRVRIPRC